MCVKCYTVMTNNNVWLDGVQWNAVGVHEVECARKDILGHLRYAEECR